MLLSRPSICTDQRARGRLWKRLRNRWRKILGSIRRLHRDLCYDMPKIRIASNNRLMLSGAHACRWPLVKSRSCRKSPPISDKIILIPMELAFAQGGGNVESPVSICKTAGLQMKSAYCLPRSGNDLVTRVRPLHRNFLLRTPALRQEILTIYKWNVSKRAYHSGS